MIQKQNDDAKRNNDNDDDEDGGVEEMKTMTKSKKDKMTMQKTKDNVNQIMQLSANKCNQHK